MLLDTNSNTKGNTMKTYSPLDIWLMNNPVGEEPEVYLDCIRCSSETGFILDRNDDFLCQQCNTPAELRWGIFDKNETLLVIAEEDTIEEGYSTPETHEWLKEEFPEEIRFARFKNNNSIRTDSLEGKKFAEIRSYFADDATHLHPEKEEVKP
jgi:hypothetical protein